jgi:hypothetical protein
MPDELPYITLPEHGHKLALKDALSLFPTAIARARVNPDELGAHRFDAHVQLPALGRRINAVIDHATSLGCSGASFGKA